MHERKFQENFKFPMCPGTLAQNIPKEQNKNHAQKIFHCVGATPSQLSTNFLFHLSVFRIY